MSGSGVSSAMPIDLSKTNRTSHRPRRRSIIREFCLNTSAHALPGIARSTSIHNRLFWSVSFISFTIVMIYFLTKTITAYFEYRTKIDVSYVSEWQQLFPAFSFCNSLAMRFDHFIGPFQDYIKQKNLTDINDTSTISELQALYIGDFFQDMLYKNKSLDSLFFSLSSVLLSCLFNGRSCTAADFTSFMSPIYGMCHTFNAQKRNSSKNNLYLANQYGGEGTLSLGVYVHSHQQIPHLSESVGIIALIHDNSQIPQMEEAGIELIPGRRHKLSYKKKLTVFASSPYTQCTEKVSPALRIVFDSFSEGLYDYSDVICFQLCAQTYTYEKCNCVNPFVWVVRKIIRPGTNETIEAPLCHATDSCYKEAFETLFDSFTLIRTYCSDCAEKCSITDFVVQVSSSLTPMEWHMSTIKSEVENLTIPLPVNWSTHWRKHIHENYLAINVVRETNVLEKNVQSGTMGLVDVLSSIGGHCGLWVGISFLSIMEVIEMIYRLIRYQYYSIQSKRQVKQGQNYN